MLRVFLLILIVLASRTASAQTPGPVDPRLGCDTAPGFPIADLGEPQNIDVFKKQLLYYRCTTYESDVARVLDAAQKWVAMRAPQVAKPSMPTIVLDIDETSLSNWPRIYLDDFAFIPNGTCDLKAGDACGDLEWQQSGAAQALQPTLKLYKAARCIEVPSPCTPVDVFFITGRHDSEKARDWTVRNLKLAGYGDIDREHLYMRGDSSGSVSNYKTSKRMDIESKGFVIIANIGDQKSDLAGGHAEVTFKVPNPFYFLP
jgi:acid phosphatase